MEILIQFTDGTKEPLTVYDDSINQNDTFINLIGNNAYNYGPYVMESTLAMLENFADGYDLLGTTIPTNGIEGQLVWNRTAQQFFVFGKNNHGNTTSGEWGPLTVGGWTTEIITDTLGIDHHVSVLRHPDPARDEIIAVMASDTEFAPDLTVMGSSYSDFPIVNKGLTMSAEPGYDIVSPASDGNIEEDIDLNGNNVYLDYGNIVFGDIDGYGSDLTSSDIDMIRFDEATNTYHFIADGSASDTGNAIITAAEFTGNSATASKLLNTFNLAMAGDLTGNIDIDGSGDLVWNVQVNDDSHNHVMSNIDGLAQEFLDTIAQVNLYTDNEIIAHIGDVTVDGSAGNTLTDRIATSLATANAYTDALETQVYAEMSRAVTISETPPATPVDGQLWFDTFDGGGYSEREGGMMIYSADAQAWIDFSSLVHDVTQYQAIADTARDQAITSSNSYTNSRETVIRTDLQVKTVLSDQPPANPHEGQLWFDTEVEGSLFVWSTTAGAWLDATSIANDMTTLQQYTNNEISALDIALRAYTDQAESDAIATANAFTTSSISAIVDTAPAALNTLNELAAALGDDPNFATTVTNTLATKADKATTISAGTGLTGGGSLGANRTISHADTSTQASVNNSNGTVIQDITLDTFGHITGIASYNLDSRYYTETEVNTLLNGKLDVGAKAADSNLLDGLDSTAFARVNTTTDNSNDYLHIARNSTGATLYVNNYSTGDIARFFKGGTNSATTGTSQVTITNNGQVRATGDVFAYYSDERLKTKVAPITQALDKVCKLTGWYYYGNEKAGEFGYDMHKQEVGLMAQDVEAVMPEVVHPAPIDPQYKTVKYERLVPLLVESIKELKEENDWLKAEMQMLKSMINEIKGR